MYTFEHTVSTPASAEAVWALYADVAEWLRWDHGLEAIELDGGFEAGATGRITPAGMGELPFTLTRVAPGRGFDDETLAMGHVFRFIHVIEPLGEGSRVTHRVEIEGPAADEMGPNVVADTPDAMLALAALAEGRVIAQVRAASPA